MFNLKQPTPEPNQLMVDCDDCVMQNSLACQDCVVTHLLEPAAPLVLQPVEQTALDTLAAEGLVPQLRMLPTEPPSPLSATG